ncbi:hypothetical protein BASA83_010468 [Batrachochytrium salamandrivorans]|nr:hypothetical protein BASA83_010468 [Batrachochytrium salamandrivorans]
MPYQTLDDDIQILQQIPDAATQNAHQSLGATSQDTHQYQGISNQDLQQSLADADWGIQRNEQDKVRAEIDKLTKAYNGRKNSIKRNFHVNIEKKRYGEVRDMIGKIASKLRETGLSSDKKPELQQIIYELTMLSDQLIVSHSKIAIQKTQQSADISTPTSTRIFVESDCCSPFAMSPRKAPGDDGIPLRSTKRHSTPANTQEGVHQLICSCSVESMWSSIRFSNNPRAWLCASIVPSTRKMATLSTQATSEALPSSMST